MTSVKGNKKVNRVVFTATFDNMSKHICQPYKKRANERCVNATIHSLV